MMRTRDRMCVCVLEPSGGAGRTTVRGDAAAELTGRFTGRADRAARVLGCQAHGAPGRTRRLTTDSTTGWSGDGCASGVVACRGAGRGPSGGRRPRSAGRPDPTSARPAVRRPQTGGPERSGTVPAGTGPHQRMRSATHRHGDASANRHSTLNRRSPRALSIRCWSCRQSGLPSAPGYAGAERRRCRGGQPAQGVVDHWGFTDRGSAQRGETDQRRHGRGLHEGCWSTCQPRRGILRGWADPGARSGRRARARMRRWRGYRPR